MSIRIRIEVGEKAEFEATPDWFDEAGIPTSDDQLWRLVSGLYTDPEGGDPGLAWEATDGKGAWVRVTNLATGETATWNYPNRSNHE